MAIEASVLFGIFTNLTLLLHLLLLCCNVGYPNLYFPNYALSFFLFIYLLSLLITTSVSFDIFGCQLFAVLVLSFFTYLDS